MNREVGGGKRGRREGGGEREKRNGKIRGVAHIDMRLALTPKVHRQAHGLE